MTCVSFMPIRAHQSGHRRSHVARAVATVGAPRRPTTPAGERLARARVTEIELRTSRAAGRKRSGLRCLVDDESDMADLFRQRFRRDVRQGTNAMHFANSGEDALGKLAGGVELTLIAILSDINIPGMDGLDLLGEIKRRFRRCR
jgi:hypothetical protein